MPALQPTPASLPRFVPHLDSGASHTAYTMMNPGATAGAGWGAGAFGNPAVAFLSSPLQTQQRPENLECLAHDVRNILSGLMLYGDLLATPGILNAEHGHLAAELTCMTQAATQLVENILDLALPAPSPSAAPPIATPQPLPTVPVSDLAAEVCHLQPLLAAIAGPSIKLSIITMPCAGLLRLAVEDLARILVNLVRNAADAMPSGGHVRIVARYCKDHAYLGQPLDGAFTPPHSVLLSIGDNGPGIPAHLRENIFDFGFTTRNPSPSPKFPSPRRRGLGLSTVRHLVESAGGSVALSLGSAPGACFEINLPLVDAADESITSGTYPTQRNSTFATDSAMKGRLECR